MELLTTSAKDRPTSCAAATMNGDEEEGEATWREHTTTAHATNGAARAAVAGSAAAAAVGRAGARRPTEATSGRPCWHYSPNDRCTATRSSKSSPNVPAARGSRVPATSIRTCNY